MNNIVLEYFPSLHSRAIANGIDTELKAFFIFKAIVKKHNKNISFVSKELIINEFLEIYKRANNVNYSKNHANLLLKKLIDLQFITENSSYKYSKKTRNTMIRCISMKSLILKLGIKIKDISKIGFLLKNILSINIIHYTTECSLQKTLILEDLRYLLSSKERSNTIQISKYNNLYKEQIKVQDFKPGASIRMSQDILSRYVFGNMSRRHVSKYMNELVEEGLIKSYTNNDSIVFELDGYMQLKFYAKYENHEKIGPKDKYEVEYEFESCGKKLIDIVEVEEPCEIDTKDLEKAYPTIKNNNKNYKYQANTIEHNFKNKKNTKNIQFFVANKFWLVNNYGNKVLFVFKKFQKIISNIINNIENIVNFLNTLKYLKPIF